MVPYVTSGVKHRLNYTSLKAFSSCHENKPMHCVKFGKEGVMVCAFFKELGPLSSFPFRYLYKYCTISVEHKDDSF